MDSRHHIRPKLGMAYGLFYLGYMALFPFEAIYLTSLGYGTEAVALLSTCTSVGNFLVQFLVGRISGTKITTRKLILLLLALAVPLGFTVVRFHGNLALVIFTVLPVTLADFSLIGQLDSYTLSTPEVHYSSMRTLGSLTGAAATMFLGRFYTRWGIDKMFLIHGACLALCFLSVLRLPEEPVSPKSKQQSRGSVKTFLPLLLGGGLLFLPWRVILVYLPVALLSLGGDASHQGVAMSIMSFSIMPVLMAYPWLRKRCSCRCLLTLGGLAMIARLGWMANSTAPWMLTAAQLLEALSYGLTQPAIMELLGRAAPELRARAVSIWTGIQMALCTVIANGLVSLLNGRRSLNEIFGLMIPPTAAGILILLFAPCTKEVCENAG